MKAYWRQQVGYGKSEALLERKHPNKFNPWGHTFWAGRIYAPYPHFRLFGRPVIYHGLWGSGAVAGPDHSPTHAEVNSPRRAGTGGRARPGVNPRIGRASV